MCAWVDLGGARVDLGRLRPGLFMPLAGVAWGLVVRALEVKLSQNTQEK